VLQLFISHQTASTLTHRSSNKRQMPLSPLKRLLTTARANFLKLWGLLQLSSAGIVNAFQLMRLHHLRVSPKNVLHVDAVPSSSTGAILGGGRPTFSGSSALGANKAPIFNLSSEHTQNGKAAAMLQSNMSGHVMSSNVYAGDDSKVSWPLQFVALFFSSVCTHHFF
jgi:hypothetical protein